MSKILKHEVQKSSLTHKNIDHRLHLSTLKLNATCYTNNLMNFIFGECLMNTQGALVVQTTLVENTDIY